MLISAAPVAIPISTANPSTELVASEAAQRTPVPEATPATENSNTKNSTENNQQTKVAREPERQVGEKNASKERQRDSSQDSSEQSQDQQLKRQELQQKRQIEQLKSRDREVRAHEAAHAGVGGIFAGAPQLSFTTGPDGKRYATSGEVSIDTSEVPNDPKATLSKMQQIRQAALAPAEPSSQDLKVAAIASQIANQALVELNLDKGESTQTQEASQSEETSSIATNDDSRDLPSATSANQNQSEDNLQQLFSRARLGAAQLNNKIVNSGALDNADNSAILSQIA